MTDSELSPEILPDTAETIPDAAAKGFQGPYTVNSPPLTISNTKHPTERAVVEQDTYFPTRDEARAFLWRTAISNGHGIAIERTYSKKGKKILENGVLEPRNTHFQCESPGKTSKRMGKSQPKHSISARCECPWRAVCSYSPEKQLWGIAILNDNHNHRPSLHSELNPYYRSFLRTLSDRKLPQTTFRETVLSLVEAGKSSSQIASLLSTPETPVLPEDVKYAMRILRRERFGPRSATQIFLQELENLQKDGGASLNVENHPQTQRIHRIFWAYKDSIQLWKELLSFDNTYKVNRFNIPLLQIGGITGLHTNFSVAFALPNGEDEDSFFWSLSQLVGLAEQHNIASPLVIMSDFDKALKNAARRAFETSQQQLCVRYILKNIVHNIKQKWEGRLGDFAGRIYENGRVAGCQDANHDAYNDAGSPDDEIHPAVQAIIGPLIEEGRAATFEGIDRGPDTMLRGFCTMVYASDEETFWKSWQTLKHDFKI